MELKQLKSKSRLPEVFNLRVDAYEQSPYSMYVNRELYPNGYFDELDLVESAIHWIVEDNDKIVGSVRIVILDDKELLNEDLSNVAFPAETPFAFCGRTVVHPLYRKTNVLRLLDKAVVNYLKEDTTIKFGFCIVIPERGAAAKRMGFKSIGMCVYDWGKSNQSNLEALIWRHADSNNHV